MDILWNFQTAKTVSLDYIDPPAAVSDDASDWERLTACMLLLSADHQEILRLKYFADLSYRELADALSIPQGTVMSRLHLARNALASKMREEK